MTRLIIGEERALLHHKIFVSHTPRYSDWVREGERALVSVSNFEERLFENGQDQKEPRDRSSDHPVP